VAIDNDLPTGTGDILIGIGELPGVFVKSVEGGNKDKDVQEENDNKRCFTQWLVIETSKMGLDLTKFILEICSHSHAASFVNRQKKWYPNVIIRFYLRQTMDKRNI
jgi:hypothetical protein